MGSPLSAAVIEREDEWTIKIAQRKGVSPLHMFETG